MGQGALVNRSLAVLAVPLAVFGFAACGGDDDDDDGNDDEGTEDTDD
jgi:hypothetical protein